MEGGRERECEKRRMWNESKEKLDRCESKKKCFIRFCINAQLKPSAPLRDMEAYLKALPKTYLIPQMRILRFL